ncbi:MAG: hypothetical protein A2075_24030 [Geobacteraceae bacterium GWC2_58_44]|nr:MAG: hypothetical protein A2075_24030 [Geobacteraceae bacterium GWC2_58_44]
MERKVRLKSLVTALLVLLAVNLIGGCGYRPVALRGPIAEANGVNVTLFANRSYRPGVEAILARDLVDEFALRSGGRVLPGGQARLELTGAVLSYANVPISYTALDTIKEYKAVLSVQAVLREQQTQKVLWKGDLSEEQSYPVNDNIALQQNAEEAAIAKVSRRLSERIWQKIGERF